MNNILIKSRSIADRDFFFCFYSPHSFIYSELKLRSMHIVVLDAYTLNPGDLSWEEMSKLGKLEIHDRTSQEPESVLKVIGDAEVVFSNKTLLPEEVLRKAPNLKYVGILATGFNVVDIDVAKELGITVTNIPAYSTVSVAQFTFALVLELCHRVGDHSLDVRSGGWSASKDFAYWLSPQIELDGLTFGMIGFGAIGKATAKVAKAFGMNVLVYNRTRYSEYESDRLKFVELDEMLANSDVVSLHCPLTEETKGIINAENISKMKSSAFLINTSRGPVINESDVAEALNRGEIAGAAVDVASVEPINADNPLLTAQNCIITPHIAWANKSARTRLMRIAVNNLKAFKKGAPINVVN